jgi:hypothetical protein
MSANLCFFLRYPARKLHLFCVILHCHLWILLLYHIIHITKLTARFERKKNNSEHKKCLLDSPYNFCLKCSSF